ncbi:MAG: SGNH/GDSL hydrolase family protein [Kiritimatiellae bacterium]|jgi:lysophospholipase L1-like esterase|nr:SGNH/GDSL hydrolase family protein [Kiritimatiellia bacterium]
MLDRRNFIKGSAVAAGVAALCSKANSETKKPAGNISGVAGYNYRLPEFKKGSRILFQGDSITDMKWGRNQKDRNHYLGHSYVYLIASRLGVDMPEAQLDVYTRGVSGNTVADLRARWQKDAIDMQPDLLSILIGTNDVGRGVKPDAFESDYRYILDASRRANTELRLVLLEPFVLQSGGLTSESAWKSRRAAIDKMRVVVAHLAKDYDAVFIRTQDIFDAAAAAVSPEQWIWDGIHPLPQGHELIARNWVQAVSARWNFV